MPWASSVRPSLSVGTVVAAAKNAGFYCTSDYPNLTFSGLIGHEAYEYFAETPALFPIAEHLFAVDLFGADALDSDAYIADFFKSSESTEVCVFQISAIQKMRDSLIPNFLGDWSAKMGDLHPDIVGFSCTFNQVLASLAAARRLRGILPRAVIVFGGACVHGKMGEAYANAFRDYVDCIFTGEADISFVTFLQLLSAGDDITSIPGMTANGWLRLKPLLVHDLEALPVPHYSDYFAQRETLLSRGVQLADFTNIPFESSRGCWWGEKRHCTFCGLNNEGMNYRTKSSAKVISELIELSAKYHTIHFMAADNILTYRGYRDLLPKLASVPIDFKLFYEIKANLNREDVAALADAGISWVQPGIESFSDHVLNLMRKGITALRNIQSLKWMAEFGIKPSYNILVGFPDETDDDYESMIALLPALFHLPSPSGRATLVQVHRFSPFFYTPQEFGIMNMRPEEYYKHLIPSHILSASEYAYFFTRDLPDNAPYLRYIVKLNAIIDNWITSGTRIVAQLGPDFIELNYTGVARKRRVVLDPLGSLVFVAADQEISIESLCENLMNAAQFTSTQVVQTVERLTKMGILIQHNRKVLSIIPFEKPHRRSCLERWTEVAIGRCEPEIINGHIESPVFDPEPVELAAAKH